MGDRYFKKYFKNGVQYYEIVDGNGLEMAEDYIKDYPYSNFGVCFTRSASQSNLKISQVCFECSLEDMMTAIRLVTEKEDSVIEMISANFDTKQYDIKIRFNHNYLKSGVYTIKDGKVVAKSI